jgi:predicted metal-dependent hydrolase
MTVPHIDEIIRSKRKTIALIVQRDGKVVVRAPARVSRRQILAFVQNKSAWLDKTLEKMRKNPAAPAGCHFEEGELFWFLGRKIPLRLVAHQKAALLLDQCFQDHCFKLKVDQQPQARLHFENWYKSQARRLLTERTAFYSQKFGFSYKKINITSARTRWGSCSTRGSISYTWRLVLAPLDVIDYVILHELTHTRAPNHSQKFWSLLEAVLPDYRLRRAWLKKNGEALRFD